MSKKPPFQFNLDPLFSAFSRQGGVQELGGGWTIFGPPLPQRKSNYAYFQKITFESKLKNTQKYPGGPKIVHPPPLILAPPPVAKRPKIGGLE